MRIRQNINDLNDDTLLWYSRAVIEMKKRDITDPTSWWYQGAVHGYGVEALPDFSEREVWSQATGFPPPQSLVDSEFWQQCQHGTWYFLPWHRMYLMFFEEIVAKTVQELGGPADWTLPYWNYCNAYNPALSEREQVEARRIPEAFGSEDGPNQEYPGLWIKERAHYEIQKRNVSCSQAMQRQAFTTEVARASFGGGVTGFSHNGSSTGQLEQLPHNVVHVDVGEVMGDPNTAGIGSYFLATPCQYRPAMAILAEPG